jgi:hypothetical protein
MRPLHPVLIVIVLGCSRAPKTDAADGGPKEAVRLAASLPERIATFDTGPLARGDGFTRRTYSRANAHVTVTLAHIDLGPGGYDRWVKQSEEGYQQAKLDLPAGAGNGFYQCVDAMMSRCNLLIQLRNGTHVEIRGDDTTMRADVDAVAVALRIGEP